MGKLNLVQGDLFESPIRNLGQGVNTHGVMGSGIAVPFKLTWYAMYEEYRELCKKGLLKGGDVHVWSTPLDVPPYSDTIQSAKLIVAALEEDGLDPEVGSQALRLVNEYSQVAPVAATISSDGADGLIVSWSSTKSPLGVSFYLTPEGKPETAILGEHGALESQGLLAPEVITLALQRLADSLIINIFNIASQVAPGADARMDLLESGVRKSLAILQEMGETDLALPRIGCGIGGLVWDEVAPLLETIAADYDVNITVYTPV